MIQLNKKLRPRGGGADQRRPLARSASAAMSHTTASVLPSRVMAWASSQLALLAGVALSASFSSALNEATIIISIESFPSSPPHISVVVSSPLTRLPRRSLTTSSLPAHSVKSSVSSLWQAWGSKGEGCASSARLGVPHGLHGCSSPKKRQNK